MFCYILICFSLSQHLSRTLSLGPTSQGPDRQHSNRQVGQPGSRQTGWNRQGGTDRVGLTGCSRQGVADRVGRTNARTERTDRRTDQQTEQTVSHWKVWTLSVWTLTLAQPCLSGLCLSRPVRSGPSPPCIYVALWPSAKTVSYNLNRFYIGFYKFYIGFYSFL